MAKKDERGKSRGTYPWWRLFFGQSFAAARRRLYITTPYFVPDAGTRRLVEQRARAGVDVRMLLPDEHTDAKPIRLTAHRYYEEMLDAGVRVYEYQATMMHTRTSSAFSTPASRPSWKPRS